MENRKRMIHSYDEHGNLGWHDANELAVEHLVTYDDELGRIYKILTQIPHITIPHLEKRSNILNVEKVQFRTYGEIEEDSDLFLQESIKECERMNQERQAQEEAMLDTIPTDDDLGMPF